MLGCNTHRTVFDFCISCSPLVHHCFDNVHFRNNFSKAEFKSTSIRFEIALTRLSHPSANIKDRWWSVSHEFCLTSLISPAMYLLYVPSLLSMSKGCVRIQWPLRFLYLIHLCSIVSSSEGSKSRKSSNFSRRVYFSKEKSIYFPFKSFRLVSLARVKNCAISRLFIRRVKKHFVSVP